VNGKQRTFVVGESSARAIKEAVSLYGDALKRLADQ
jgi:hypothetical protein